MISTMKHTNQSGFVVWILIVVGLILALTVMGFFTQNVKRAYNTTETDEPTVVSNPTTPTITPPTEPVVECGLNVETPKEGATMQSPAVIQGYTNGCGWEVVDGNLATVQLYTSAGVAVTTPIPVSLLGSTSGATVSFFTTLVYPDSAATSSGYLLFVHSGSGFTKQVNVKY